MPPRPLVAGTLLLTACSRKPVQEPITPALVISGRPDIPYPPDLFQQRVEGEVLLYLVVDSSGTSVRDSTRIARSSGRAAFDSAALAAAPSLKFTAGRRGSVAVTSAIQVPIRFTLPDSLKP